MIRVRFTKQWSSRQAGDTQVLPDELARAIIRDGLAVAVETPSAEIVTVGEIECAAIEPERTAVMGRPRRKRKRK